MHFRVLIAAATEVSYAVFTRTWLRGQLDGIELELAITAVRLVTVVIDWALFRELIVSRPRSFQLVNSPLMVSGALVALAIPFLFCGWSPGGGFGTALTFALTSAVVGLREELLYRAVLLNLLQPKLGAPAAMLVSTGLFVVYHLGAQPMAPLWITECVCLSLLLGVIYLRTGSLLAIVLFHIAYDAIWFFGPFLAVPLQDAWRPAFLVSALAVVFWASRGPRGTTAALTSPP